MHVQTSSVLSNWSGSVRLRPARVAQPASEQELCEVVRETMQRRGTLRVVAARHSSSPQLLETEDTLVRMDRLKELEIRDGASREVWAGPGISLKELGHALLKEKLGLRNYGDVDVQTLAGAIGTGTHGSGRRLQNLAAMLTGARVVDGRGDVHEFTVERSPDVIRALRVSLGAVGILARIRIDVVDAYELQRKEWCTTFDRALEVFDDLADRHRNVDFYWYPRSDEVKLRTLDEPGRLPSTVSGARLIEEESGWAADVLPRERLLRFEEMEYAVPANAGLACLREVRDRVRALHRRVVGWRVLYRLVAADDAYLSTAQGYDIATISLHHNAGLPFHEYFSDMEPVFRAHGGRPHWAKKHSLTGDALSGLYPEWTRFLSVRERMDRAGVFLSPGMQKLLGLDKGAT